MQTEEKIQEIEEKAKNLEKKIDAHSIVWEVVKKTEREKKRWFIAWLITFVLLLSIIAGGIYLFATSDVEVWTLTQTTESGGDANYYSAGGDLNYGISKDNSH